MACYCCISGCKSNNHKRTGKHFFRFPTKDKKRQKLWQRFARKNVKTTAVICEDHFDPKYMVQKDKKLKLSSNAVPTIFYKETEEGFKKVTVEFDGKEYFGEEAEVMVHDYEMLLDQEMLAIETAFVNEQFTLEDMKARCRFCAEPKENQIELSSFTSFNIDVEAFLRSLNLHIIESDFFPSTVCEDCFNQVMNIDTFIVKCRGADQWLLEEIGKLKTITAAIPTKPEDGLQMDASLPKEDELFLTNNHSNEEARNESFLEMMQESRSENDDTIDQVIGGSFEATEDEKRIETESTLHANDVNEDAKGQPKLHEYAIMNPNLNKFAIKSYHCEICLKVFAGLKTYKNHQCDVPEIKCEECGDRFLTVFALKSHRRHLHSRTVEKHYCPICKTVITGKLTVFKKHKTKCNRERVGNIKCGSCELTFKTLYSYTAHQMFHENKLKTEEDVLAVDKAKPSKRKAEIICELCGKIYTTIGDCRRHIKLKHTEITEVFSCEICKKNYPSSSVLKDHIRNTHVVNEVSCTFCGKVFRNKTHLKKHMVYHDHTKKVHKCLICPDQPGFINKVGLIRHQARHANSDQKVFYSCEICINYNFHTCFQLKSHLKHVHGIDQ